MGSNYCRVENCTEYHEKHFCKHCKDKNSNHFAYDCPEKLLKIYHGTSDSAAAAIMAGDYKPTINGTLGDGIYFTPDKQSAEQIAKHRAEITDQPPAVVVNYAPQKAIMRRSIGKCLKEFSREITFMGGSSTWVRDEQREGRHQKWCTTRKGGFKEFKVDMSRKDWVTKLEVYQPK